MATIAVRNTRSVFCSADPRPKQLAHADGRADRQQREDVRLGIKGLRPLGGANGLFRDRFTVDLLAGDDVQADIAARAQQIAHHRAVEQLEPPRARGFADDHLGDVVGLRKGDHVVGDAAIAAGIVTGSPPSAWASRKRIGDAVTLLLGQLQTALRLDIERRPRRMQAVGEALGVAHQPGGARVLADADEQTIAGGPWPRDGPRLHLGEQLLVDALGGAAQRQLAKRRQVGRREEVLERPLGLLGDVDLAFLEALDQVVGGDVDELDGVGAIEDRVGHGLADADAR